MKKYFCLLLISSLLISCGEKIVWDRPQQDYRKCLQENPNDPSKCGAQKESYERKIEELKGKSTDEGGAGSLYEE